MTVIYWPDFLIFTYPFLFDVLDEGEPLELRLDATTLAHE